MFIRHWDEQEWKLFDFFFSHDHTTSRLSLTDMNSESGISLNSLLSVSSVTYIVTNVNKD